MPVGKGASKFQQQLRARHLGVVGSLRRNMKTLGDWARSIQTIQAHIREVQRIRWQDKVEEAEEDDEATTAIMVKVLTLEDPELYSTHLNVCLRNSVAEFEEKLRDAALKIQDADSGHENALYILRTIREVEQRLEVNLPDARLSQVQAIIPSLQKKLAAEVVKRLSTAIETRQKLGPKLTGIDFIPSYLPSPCAFRTLHQLCTIMADLGGIDIWTETAVSAVKKAAKIKIFDEDYKLFYMRNRFDEIYLEEALNIQPDPVDKSNNEESEERVKAVEYWTRTKLLFGLLA